MVSYTDRHKIPQKQKRFSENVHNLRDLECVSNSFPRRPAAPPRKHKRRRHLGLKDSRLIGASCPSSACFTFQQEPQIRNREWEADSFQTTACRHASIKRYLLLVSACCQFISCSCMPPLDPAASPLLTLPDRGSLTKISLARKQLYLYFLQCHHGKKEVRERGTVVRFTHRLRI